MSSISNAFSRTPAGARYEALLEVAESIAAHRQLATLFADLSRCLRGLVSFDFISLTLLDPKANVFRLHILHTDREVIGDKPPETPYDQSPTGEALRTRQPYLVRDVSDANGYPVLENLLRANGVRSYCVLPLFTAQRELGGLSFGSRAARRLLGGRHRVHAARGAPGGRGRG